MADGLTPSEKFVAAICERSFLRLWTHPNPRGKKGKELCDCLIVCGPHIIIISVKEIDYKDTGDKTGWDRWVKAAIEKSASQIWGAERWLESASDVERSDGRVVALPEKDRRQYHRISVSLGGRRDIPIMWGDLGHGFVHVCDEYSVGELFSAIDTITDFTEFLTRTENLANSGVQIVFDGGGIEDLLGLYLMHDRSFEVAMGTDEQPAMMIVHDDLWREFKASEHYEAMQRDLSSSYMWDRLIEVYVEDLLTDGIFDMHSKEVTRNELALVTMALQPRSYRATLADSFIDFLKNDDSSVASRAAKGHGDSAFVFLIGKSSDREIRSQELGLRCLVIRGRLADTKTVVGIATDRPGTSDIGYSSDIVCIHIDQITDEIERQVTGIQEELGYFKDSHWYAV